MGKFSHSTGYSYNSRSSGLDNRLYSSTRAPVLHSGFTVHSTITAVLDISLSWTGFEKRALNWGSLQKLSCVYNCG